MVLEVEGAFFDQAAQGGGGGGLRADGDVVLDENAVVQDGEGTVAHGAVRGFLGGAKDDVVGLPFARLATGVDQRGAVAVERAALAVGIGLVLVAVQDLDLVAAHQIDAAIAPALAAAFDGGGRRPLDVHLAVRELFFGEDAALGGGFHDAVFELPLGLGAAFAAEF